MTQLCPIQHKWLTLHPCEASSQLDSLTKTVAHLRTLKQWSQAKGYLFRAKEIVEILFEIERYQISPVPFQFTNISVSLADTMRKLGEDEQAIEVLQTTKEKFEIALESGAYQPNVKLTLTQCVEIIKKGLRLFSH